MSIFDEFVNTYGQSGLDDLTQTCMDLNLISENSLDPIPKDGLDPKFLELANEFSIQMRNVSDGVGTVSRGLSPVAQMAKDKLEDIKRQMEDDQVARVQSSYPDSAALFLAKYNMRQFK